MTKQKFIIIMLSSLLSFFGCKGQSKGKEKEKVNQQVDKSIEDFLKRPIYSVLTVKILDSIDDDKLEQTIMDNIFWKLDSNDSSEKQYELIKSLSMGRQSIFATLS